MRMGTTVQMQQSTYLASTAMIGAVGKKSVKLCNAQRLRLPQVAVSDLSVIYPEAVVASSQALGWQNIRAVEMCHELTEWAMPPLENHCIIVQLGQPVNISARIDGHSFDRRVQPGEIAILPAGVPPNGVSKTLMQTMRCTYTSPTFRAARQAESLISVRFHQAAVRRQRRTDSPHRNVFAVRIEGGERYRETLRRFAGDGARHATRQALQLFEGRAHESRRDGTP